MKQGSLRKLMGWFLGIRNKVWLSIFFYPYVACADAAKDIAGASTTVVKQISGLAGVVRAAAYLAGLGLCVAAILKFKAHKDNPTQIPLSTPVVLLLVGAGLLFLPTIFNLAGSSLFGTTETGVSALSS
jgi:intracellular multiplication protein IcmD